MLDPYCGENLWCAGGVLVSRYEMTFAEAIERGRLHQRAQGIPVSIQEAIPDFTKEGELELTLRLKFNGKVIPYSITHNDTRVLLRQAGVEYVDELEEGVINAEVYGDSICSLFYDTFRKG